MSLGWSEPAKGILVIPGKSITVRSGHVGEYIVSTIGLLTIFFFCPATLSVKPSIDSLTLSKSKNFWFGIYSNTPHGFWFQSERWTKRNSSGLRVTTP